MTIRNPLADPEFLPTVQIIAGLFGFGFLLVLFFARKDLRAGLRGELGQRFYSWTLIAAIFLIATFVRGPVAAVILLLFLLRIAYEYVTVIGVERPYAAYLYGLVFITYLAAEFWPEYFFTLPAASILLLTLLPILTGRVENLYQQLSYAGRGYLYLIWSTAHLILLKDLVQSNALIVMVGAAIALSDVMQYTIGKLFGKHIISPNVNPRKAWEGLFGDVLGAFIVITLFNFAFPPSITLPQKLLLALLLGVGSAWGDLLSSLVKRVADAKDWGSILPGHGGILDRANSMVVALPLAYYYLHFILTGN
jgi:phosphatidate cytidylyltransferase